MTDKIVEVPGVGRVAFPDSMSNDEIADAIRTNILKEPKKESPSRVKQLGRQLGLTGRYLVEGATALPAMAADALSYVAQMGTDPIRGGNPAFIHSISQQPNTSSVISGLLDEAGLPRPEGSTEEMVAAPSRALAGGGGLLGVAQKLTGPTAAALSQLPVQQAAGAIGGGLATETARQAGLPPWAQVAAGLVGGVGVPLGVQGAAALTRSAARGTKAAAQPFTSAGRDRIAGTILANQADDAGRAASNLESATEIVPGSVQTAGAASRDAGLLALEKGIRSRNPSPFATRLSEQNAARQSALDRIAGTPADIADDVAARSLATDAAREAAFTGARQASVQRVLDKADEILASPAGARKPVQQAVGEFRETIARETDPARLYAVRQDIGDALAGKFGGEKASLKLASKELIALRESLDDAIDDAAPGFKAYLERYKELSRPINQKEALQELQNRSALAAPDITTGREFLSQARFSRNLDNLLRDKLVARSLTDDQVRTARAVAADLDLGASINSPLIRAPGSDTTQNLSLANIAASIRQGNTRSQVPRLMQPLLKPFERFYRYSDEQINELLTEAMLDPKLAAQMMRRATPSGAQALANNLSIKARQLGLGAGVGTAATTRNTTERPARER